MSKIERALISVSNKEGLAPFARGLAALGVEIISTGGTAALLRQEKIPVKDVSEITGFPEMMDGRVKTLHPKVHGGILSLRDNAEHVAQMKAHGIGPIDLVVVNLYPFESTVARGAPFHDIVENIDIGGPSMVRAAAKNFAHVGVVVDPADYEKILVELKEKGALGDAARFALAQKAFRHTAHYDGAIANYLDALDAEKKPGRFGQTLSFQVNKLQDLRYGENPHQSAAFYSSDDGRGPSIARAKQYIAEHGGEAKNVRYRLAGGLIGILAAVNEEVEWSYRVNLALILIVVFLLSYATYVSVVGALIVMLPSLVAQPLSEAVMYLFGIDMNINSLPVAAVGIGIGIDYGYYVLSRIVEELVAGEGFDVAIRRMFETTGKTVLFTGVSLTASIIFWVFFPMKFQADMALLLVLLLGFHLMGALMFIPPMVALFKPRFAIKYAEERQRIRAEAAAAESGAAGMRAAGA